MITIKDISRTLGISHATVSYVLNGREKEHRIREEVASNIRRTAEKMGYVPNAAAQDMARGKSKSIAYVERFNTSNKEFSHRLLSGVISTFTREDYMVKIFRFKEEDNEDEKVFRQILSYRIAGVLIVSPDSDENRIFLEKCHSFSIPCGILNNVNETSHGFSVRSDDAASQKEAVQHLASLGHRRIAYMEGETPWHYSLVRRNGYKEGMKEFLPGEKEMIITIPFQPFGSSAGILKQVLSAPYDQRPTAILCDSDYHAMEVFHTAYAMKLQIPEDLSIVGFGGLTPATYSPVPFATSFQKYEEMGSLAAELLLDHLRNGSAIDGISKVIQNTFQPGPSAGMIRNMQPYQKEESI